MAPSWLLALRIPIEFLEYAIARFLDTLRRMGARRRPLLVHHPLGVSFPETLKAAQWERRLMNPVGLPRGANDYPSLRSEAGEVPSGVSIRQIWSVSGFRTAAQKVLLNLTQRLAGQMPSREGVERLAGAPRRVLLPDLRDIARLSRVDRALPGERRLPEAGHGGGGSSAAVRGLLAGGP